MESSKPQLEVVQPLRQPPPPKPRSHRLARGTRHALELLAIAAAGAAAAALVLHLVVSR